MHQNFLKRARDVFTGATGATEVAPKFSDTLTLSPPGHTVLKLILHCNLAPLHVL